MSCNMFATVIPAITVYIGTRIWLHAWNLACRITEDAARTLFTIDHSKHSNISFANKRMIYACSSLKVARKVSVRTHPFPKGVSVQSYLSFRLEDYSQCHILVHYCLKYLYNCTNVQLKKIYLWCNLLETFERKQSTPKRMSPTKHQ